MGRSATVEPAANRRVHILLHATAWARNASTTDLAISIVGADIVGADIPTELVSWRHSFLLLNFRLLGFVAWFF